MTRHGEEFNEFHTRYHSIATYDMVQDSLALTFSFIIVFFVFFLFRINNPSDARQLQRRKTEVMALSVDQIYYIDLICLSHNKELGRL